MFSILNALISASAGLAFLKLTSAPLSWPDAPALIVVGISAGLLTASIFAVQRTKWYRHRFSPVEQIKGFWYIQLPTNKRPESICTIGGNGDNLVYEGIGLDTEGKKSSWWKSVDVTFEAATCMLRFSATAYVEENSDSSIDNFGWISFDERRQTAFGHFTDMSDNGVHRTSMSLTRITEEQYRSLLKKANAHGLGSAGKYLEGSSDNALGAAAS